MCPYDVYLCIKSHDYQLLFRKDTKIHFCYHLNSCVSHISTLLTVYAETYSSISLIPVAIVGATRFYATFTDVLSESQSGNIYL